MWIKNSLAGYGLSLKIVSSKLLGWNTKKTSTKPDKQWRTSWQKVIITSFKWYLEAFTRSARRRCATTWDIFSNSYSKIIWLIMTVLETTDSLNYEENMIKQWFISFWSKEKTNFMIQYAVFGIQHRMLYFIHHKLCSSWGFQKKTA